MHKLHPLATGGTHVATVDVLAPVAHVATLVVEQARLALEHLVLAAVAKVVGGAVVGVRVEAGFVGGTLDYAVDEVSLGRHELRRQRELVGQELGHDLGGGGRGRAYGLCGPHALLLRLRVPEAAAALQYRVHTGQAVVVDLAVLRVRVVAVGVPGTREVGLDGGPRRRRGRLLLLAAWPGRTCWKQSD